MKTLFPMFCLLASLLLAPLSVSAQERLNINVATVEQLLQIDGVGPSKAQAIVHYRESNGPFANIDELTKVKGIGSKIVEKNRGRLTTKEQ